MNKKWKVLVGLLVIVGLLLAQQPVAQGPQAGNAAAWLVNASQWAGTALGSPSNYGTSPGAVEVPGVNAYVTNTVPVTVTLTPSSSSTAATSIAYAVSSTSTFNTVKSSAGNLYGLYTFNPNTSVCYLVFYNNSSPTVGSTTIVAAYGVQAGLSIQLPPSTFAMLNFSTAITYATTTTIGGSTFCTTGLPTDAFYE